ncbi:MAG: tRNA methyl transferase PRC-barrel domain-containing protein [Kaistella sp.]
MTHTGQIVEIPANSVLYKDETPDFASKKEELLWKSTPKSYSLFDGFIVEGHFGLEYFQIGQRKGINVGGKKEPLYVIAMDPAENRLFVGAGESHPGLFTHAVSFPKNQLTWKTDFFSDIKNKENGILVEIASSAVDGNIPVTMYVFDDQIFFEFSKPAPTVIQYHPFRLYYNETLIAELT